MTVLVTGGTGFVGEGLLLRLSAESRFKVRAAVRGTGITVTDDVERVLINELGDANLKAALVGVDAVVHLAARVHVMRDSSVDPLAEFRRVNVAGTLNIARQAATAGVKRFVFVSSIKVNGETGTFSEDDIPAPNDAYGISKHEAEQALHRLATETGMEVVVIRPPLVYGPGVKANFRTLMRAIATGVPLPFGSIHNRRSFVSRDNLVDFIVTCLEHPSAANETFLVSDGDDLSTADLIKRLARAMNRPARLWPVPASLLLAAATVVGRRDVAERLLCSLQLDIRKARRVLGWVPPVSVEEGLCRAAMSLK